jgi:CRISPR-associated protein Cas6
MTDGPSPSMVDVAFALRGTTLARDHRLALSRALADALPWLADEPMAAVHDVKLVQGGGEPALLSARSRLVVRVRRERAGELAALAGRTLQVGDAALELGAAALRELAPHSTLYAHFVDAAGSDEGAFLDSMAGELRTLDVRCHHVCGREQRVRGPAEALRGYSLLLHGLGAAASLRVLEHGLGAHRLMGCGVFVPHKTAAAVGE